MDNGVMTQTQYNTTPQYNSTIPPPAHIRPPIPQPPLPILLHAGTLPLAPSLATLPANRTTGNADDSIGSGHVTMEMGPHNDSDPYRHALTMRPPRKVRPVCFFNYYNHFPSTHTRRRAADDATSSSHDVTASSSDGDKSNCHLRHRH